MAVLVLAPALYPAAAQVAGVVLICAFIMGIVTQTLSFALKRFLIGTAALVLSLILYFNYQHKLSLYWHSAQQPHVRIALCLY
jgi:cell shape-determining protein MreD